MHACTRGTFFRVEETEQKNSRKNEQERNVISRFFVLFCPSASVCSTFPKTHVSSRRGNRDRPGAIGTHALEKDVSKQLNPSDE
jgi:hypothetical protein